MKNSTCSKLLVIVAVILAMAHPVVFAYWSTFDLGTGGSTSNVMYTVAVGAGRNDGINRVYASNANTHIYEYTFSNNSWNKADLGAIGIPNAQVTNCIAIGNGRNDGVIRLYAACANNHIYEITYLSSTGKWSTADVGTPNTPSLSGMLGIALGNGRNDGTIRLYGASDDTHVYEFTYSGGKWSTPVDMGYPGSTSSTGSIAKTKVTLATGQNDGIMRVYASCNDSHMYEFTYSTLSGWSYNDMNYGGSFMQGVAAGNGRNDGLIKLYGANSDGCPFEFVWSGSSWTCTLMSGENNLYANAYLSGVTCANGRNDGVTRIYGSDHDTHMYEYYWTPNTSSYYKYDMGTCNGAMQAVASGIGRNDGQVRIYAANSNFHVYEFSYTTSTLLADNQSNSSISNAVVYPTYANLSKGDKINFANFTPKAQVIVITLAGHVVRTFYADGIGDIPSWDGSVDGGGKAASGTYIIHASDNVGGHKIFKILLYK